MSTTHSIDPSRTWPLASFEPPERRTSERDRREAARAQDAARDRRNPSKRSLRSLLRL